MRSSSGVTSPLNGSKHHSARTGIVSQSSRRSTIQSIFSVTTSGLWTRSAIRSSRCITSHRHRFCKTPRKQCSICHSRSPIVSLAGKYNEWKDDLGMRLSLRTWHGRRNYLTKVSMIFAPRYKAIAARQVWTPLRSASAVLHQCVS